MDMVTWTMKREGEIQRESKRESEQERERERWAKKGYETQYEFIIHLPPRDRPWRQRPKTNLSGVEKGGESASVCRLL